MSAFYGPCRDCGASSVTMDGYCLLHSVGRKPTTRCSRLGCYCLTVAATMPAHMRPTPLALVFCGPHLLDFQTAARAYHVERTWVTSTPACEREVTA